VTATEPAVLGGPQTFPEGLPLVRPTLDDIPGLARRLESVLASGMLTNGAAVRELEDRVAQRTGAAHVVAVASCTAGLMLVYQALGARGRVVMPSFTFAASAHAVAWAGGTPAWAEVDPDSLTLDPADAAGVADGAVAMSATHVYGAPCDVDALQALAGSRGIPLVYDAAHALGSRSQDRPVGGFGTAEVFSLSPTKVTVAGEGGLVATHDSGLAHAVRIGRDYGNPGSYDCEFPGLNARMSELHATVALSSLEGLDRRISWRNHLVQTFRSATHGVPGLTFQQVRPGDLSTYKDLTLVLDAEVFGLGTDDLAAALRADGVDSRHYYRPPIHRQKAYAQLPQESDLPVTDAVANRVLTVPLWSHTTEDEIRRLADLVGELQRRHGEVTSALADRPAR
jgi:dTDP-4-amino-4,6-dideoxygalactose transaminase